MIHLSFLLTNEPGKADYIRLSTFGPETVNKIEFFWMRKEGFFKKYIKEIPESLNPLLIFSPDNYSYKLDLPVFDFSPTLSGYGLYIRLFTSKGIQVVKMEL